MPWKDVSLMSQREEFVGLARHEGSNVRQLCRRFGISAKTGYKWLTRYAAGGTEALADHSLRRKPSAIVRSSGSNTRPPTTCGKWISRATWPWPTAGAVIP